jgi:hypothetical protein
MTQLQKSQQELRAAWHAGQGLKKRPRKSGGHLGRNGFRSAILGQDLYKLLFADDSGVNVHKGRCS